VTVRRHRVDPPCDAEIEDEGVALAVQQDVVGLQVAVDDALVVRRLEPGDHLGGDGDHLLEAEALFSR
jgi:hypothetical protein